MLGSRGLASTTMIWLIPVLVLAQLLPAAQVNCSFCPVAELPGGNDADRRASPISGADRDISRDPDCLVSADGVNRASGRPASGQSRSPGRKYANCPCKWGNPAAPERVSENEDGGQSFHRTSQLALAAGAGPSFAAPRQAADRAVIFTCSSTQRCVLLCRFRF